ncbi:MAG: gliding motility-associated C-terminal domain-containing protein, partial [Flavobacteriaceae bacterium]|nr:gliding motility-associated C-terminal domain-containing protein [Flavobacteriaceae bacterium]
FLVDLSGLSTSLITILTPQATGTILDNDGDGAGVSFDATSVTVNEDAGTATFTVRLSGDVQGGFTLDYATANGSAQAPVDFTAANGTLSFVGNDGEAYEITIPIIDDVIVEDMEDYVVDLLNISSPLIPILTPQATGAINDNDSESDFPSDILVSCDEIPEIPQITLNANGCEYTEVFEEAISGQNDDCATEYTITRTWTITDCVENVRVHIQTITVEDTEAPVFVEQLPGDTMVSCDEVPFAAVMNALDNCDTAAYVAFDEILTGLDDECSSEYNITRTWTAWDCAGNSTVHVQNITVIDTEAPSFVESLPSDITVLCNEVSEAVVLTAVDNCDPDIDVVFNETITNDANCASGYTITRTWTVSDCAGNSINHTQVVTIPSAGPVTANEYEKEVSILCGDPLPGTPELEFSGGCGDYDIVFTEETEYSDDTDDYMVIRTWMVTDACANTASFEQLIFVFQPQLETVTIDICVEDAAIDLVNYLPEGFDTNGEFVVTSNNYTLIGSQLNPLTLDTDNQTLIEYSSTDGTCKYYVDFVINANTDCVPCGRDDIIASTTITPNGDGVNEYFEIKGVEFCDFRFDVMLFNRWGTKVFEGKDYRNDWGANAPNNAFGSKGLLPTGTYYYIIHVTNRNIEPITGYIYIGSN